MSVLRRIADDVRYVLTDVGRTDLLCAETCSCNQLWVCDGVNQCLVCGTIYGVVYGFTVAPRKLRNTSARLS